MYTIKYTEKNNAKAHDYETRSLLYLLAMREDSDDISIFFIDCLNDVTGSSEDATKLWDTQSKGVSTLNPTKIGESLVTLFLNYLSDISFVHSILVIPKIKEGYLLDEDLKQYRIDNFKDTKRSYVIKGLSNEYLRREDISMLSDTTKKEMLIFLDKVLFVVGEDKDAYVKSIIQFKDKDSLSKSFYVSIFHEIRDKQSALKNTYIEGVEFDHPSELLEHKKHLRKNDIKLLVLNRLVGTDLFKNSFIPINYRFEVQNIDTDDLKDLIQDNNSKLSRSFFDKNNKVAFWQLLENITISINKNINKNIREIFAMLNEDLFKQNHTLDENSILFFISLIMDGLENDN